MTLTPTIDLVGTSEVVDHLVAGLASPRTRNSYRRALDQWNAWLTAHGAPLLDAERTQVEAWTRHLEDQGYALSTISQRLSTLSSFYRWCLIEQHLEHNPVDAIRRPRRSAESTTQETQPARAHRVARRRGTTRRLHLRGGLPAGDERASCRRALRRGR